MLEFVHNYTSTYARKQGYNWKKHWYEQVPKSVETSQVGKWPYCGNKKYKLTELPPNNKPDIIIRDNEKGTCMLIDAAISGDRNVIKK